MPLEFSWDPRQINNIASPEAYLYAAMGPSTGSLKFLISFQYIDGSVAKINGVIPGIAKASVDCPLETLKVVLLDSIYKKTSCIVHDQFADTLASLGRALVAETNRDPKWFVLDPSSQWEGHKYTGLVYVGKNKNPAATFDFASFTSAPSQLVAPGKRFPVTLDNAVVSSRIPIAGNETLAAVYMDYENGRSYTFTMGTSGNNLNITGHRLKRFEFMASDIRIASIPVEQKAPCHTLPRLMPSRFGAALVAGDITEFLAERKRMLGELPEVGKSLEAPAVSSRLTRVILK